MIAADGKGEPPAMRLRLALCLLAALLAFPGTALGRFIPSDTTWSGDVSLTEDVLVPAGVTLTIAAGTRIVVTPSESTKTDPEFLSSLTEITVRGVLRVEGTEASPVVFASAAGKGQPWAGIIIDGGRASIRSAMVTGAETGVYVLKGSLDMAASDLRGNHYGLAAQGPESAVLLSASRVSENDFGVLVLSGAGVERRDTVVAGNRKKDIFTSSVPDYRPQVREYRPAGGQTSRVFRDEAMLGLTVWRNRVEVNGIVRVPENSRLIILPGTVVEFRKKDTNHDGIGENGLLIQGTIIAKGTREKPIIFRSAEGKPGMGDWDSINIMNSDTSQNLIEYCQIQDAYRGMHFHFSNVAVSNSVLRNNYRGMQFQESVVSIRDSYFYDNKSAFQARDSEIAFSGNLVYRNYTGMNIFRNSITLSGNTVLNNYLEGLRVREGLPLAERNLMAGNRHGLMVSDAFFGSYGSNVISHNLETGISLRSTEGIEIAGNVVQFNGINGVNIQDSSAFIHGNLITDNAERGVGVVTFRGLLTGNTITANGLYNLGIDGPSEVSAAGNWWGTDDIRRTIFDQEDDPAKGKAVYVPVMEMPPVVSWPLPSVRADAAWRGAVAVERPVEVATGTNLAVAPGTRVLFSKDAGLTVKGRITARGEKQATIAFTADGATGPGVWNEVLLDHAPGSEFANCRFEHAAWALHSHFTDLKVTGCVFENNTGGIRFTSGPITVTGSLFTGNEIGIRAFRGSALITGNVITRNQVGIFVREKGGGLTIRGNNIFANSDYNIRAGDFNDEDVNARDNWWGVDKPEETIFDARREPGIGTVVYEPAAARPFELQLPAGRGAGAAVR